MSDKAIEVLLDEKRNFLPPKQFKKSTHARSTTILSSAGKNPQAFGRKPPRSWSGSGPGKRFWNGIRHGPNGSSEEESRPPTTVWTGMSKG
jgi:hypothetical protein